MYEVRYGPVMSPFKNGNKVSGSAKTGLAELLVTSQEDVLYVINRKKNKGIRSVKLIVRICKLLFYRGLIC